MAARIAVTGDPGLLRLAGLPDAPADAGLVVALGPPEKPPGVPWVLWCEDDCFPDPGWERTPERVIAPLGEERWRHAPLPVNDALFELEPAAEQGIAVAVEDPERRADLVERIGDHAGTEACDRLTEDVLRRATVVIMSAGSERFPGRAFAALAARRVLVLDGLPAAFGLLAGRDHVKARTDAEAVLAAISVTRHVRSFTWMRELGARAAERHRASRVYARLATDLELEGLAR